PSPRPVLPFWDISTWISSGAMKTCPVILKGCFSSQGSAVTRSVLVLVMCHSIGCRPGGCSREVVGHHVKVCNRKADRRNRQQNMQYRRVLEIPRSLARKRQCSHDSFL